jgi:hypothetical protein
MTRRLDVVTNSQLTTFRRCQREHYYAYLCGYRTLDDAEALRFGTLWHKGLEAWWLGRGLDAALDAATAGALDEYEAARARVLLRGYEARWGHESLDVVGVEREFCTPLVNPETGAASRSFELAGKLDVLLTDRFVEHKTTGEDIGVGSFYWRRLTLDPQVSTYYAGAKSLGHDVHGCVYDVVRKLSLRPSKAVPVVDDEGCRVVLSVVTRERVRTKNRKKWRETADANAGYVMLTREETVEEYEARCTDEVAAHPDRYYQRGEVVRLEADEREAALDAWHLTQAMLVARRLGHYPRNPDACQRYGRPCSYFEVCLGVASLDDPARFQRVENVHQELTEGTNHG